MFKSAILLLLLTVTANFASAQSVEIFCSIRSSGSSLNCQLLGKDRRTMSSDDISNFLNQAQVSAFVTLKSRKGLERTYQVDANSPQYKRYQDIKKSASISEVNKAGAELFNEIEKKLIKTSDDLDAQSATAELVLYDPSITYDKMKRESSAMQVELEGFKKNRDKICTTTPGFEQVSNANQALQKTLSNILYAFQTPDTCMSKEMKIFKNADGTVDLRQLDSVADTYKSQCKTKK
jgi:hypothetical protein